MVLASLPYRFLGKAHYIIMITTFRPSYKKKKKNSFFYCVNPTCTINVTGILVYGFIHIEYKIVHISELFNLCYKTSSSRWEKETTAVCLFWAKVLNSICSGSLEKSRWKGKRAGFCLYS